MIVGIDVGTEYVGYAILTDDGLYWESGRVRLSSKESRKVKGWESLKLRLNALCNWLELYLDGYDKITSVGIEHPWVGKNPQTALSLGIAFGYVASAAQRRGLDIQNIAPSQAKKALVGKGNATKEEMMHSARLVVGEEVPEDEADAIGVAFAASTEEKLRCL